MRFEASVRDANQVRGIIKQLSTEGPRGCQAFESRGSPSSQVGMKEELTTFFPRALKAICCILALCFFLAHASAQTSIDETSRPANAGNTRERGLEMLGEVKNVIKENYYDPTFRGIDLDQRFKAAAERIKTMSTNSQVFRVIAQVLVEFNDSHTSFIPPSRTNRVEYGFSMQIIGRECYIVDVKKGSYAEAKGLQAGDMVLKIGPYMPVREAMWKISYLIYALDPQEKLMLRVRSLQGTEREVQIESKTTTPEERRKEAEKRKAEKTDRPYKCQEISLDTITCKLYSFSVEKSAIDKMMKEAGAHKNFILDLRGNRGGYIATELYLTGYFFDHDVKIGDEVTRKKTRERIAKSAREKVYAGKLMVLIDSDSASASEVFARVVQIEKRGNLAGDVSAGAVMASQFYPLAVGHGTSTTGVYTVFAISVTVGDLVMADGGRLEGVGVIPDFPVGPTGFALFKKTDPVLAFAANKFGAQLSAEKAGQFFFMRQKPEEEEKEADDSVN